MTAPIRRATTRPANPAETQVFARLIDEFFQSVSFRAGERPNYRHIDELFVPGGMLIKNTGEVPEISSVPEFIASRQKLVDAGQLTAFRETERAEITEWFGNIAHRLSAYDKQGTLNGQRFEARGVISTQFIRTPSGWRISSMAWDDERAGLAIPDSYRGS